MDKIMSCMFLNPVWEQFHKTHRTTGTRTEKTKYRNQQPRASVVTTMENMTKTQKPSFSLFCFCLYAYMQAMIQGEVSLCSLDARTRSSLLNRNPSSPTSHRSGEEETKMRPHCGLQPLHKGRRGRSCTLLFSDQ